ncbi:hypothetical protein DES41_11846 [Pseudorhodoferax soli]|uniref:Uncharacterized protein n=1 Tax=Pseudorhodoferax soli TaxID=545864 RepID=A0A368X6N6_9BURK|nr:hypothetical protein DES41_11846 [Pseudorhodoferax soli]
MTRLHTPKVTVACGASIVAPSPVGTWLKSASAAIPLRELSVEKMVATCLCAGSVRSRSLARMVLHMRHETFPNHLPESHGNSISDQATNSGHVDSLTGLHELVSPRKCLQDCALAQRERTVLLGMTKSTAAEAVELSSDSGRRKIPIHPSIHAGKALSCFALVARRKQIRIPIAPASARASGPDSALVEFGEPTRPVDWIVLRSFTRTKRLHSLYCRPNSASPVTLRVAITQLQLAESRGKQDQTGAGLRNSVLLALNDADTHLIVVVAERLDEPSEDRMLSHLRNVLHGHQCRQALLNNTAEMLQHRPPSVGLVGLVKAVSRERLAGCAPSQK